MGAHIAFHNCGHCSLYSPQQAACLRFKIPMTSSDYCSKFTSQDLHCAVCGNMFLPESLFIVEDSYQVCAQCVPTLSSCTFCRNAANCSFEDDPSSLPKIKNIRQGHIVVQARNPDRIRETCQKGCPCYSSEMGCRRQINYCENIDTMPLAEKVGPPKTPANYQA